MSSPRMPESLDLTRMPAAEPARVLDTLSVPDHQAPEIDARLAELARLP